MLDDHRARYFAEDRDGCLDFLSRMDKDGLSFEQADGVFRYFWSFIGAGGVSDLVAGIPDWDSDEESDEDSDEESD